MKFLLPLLFVAGSALADRPAPPPYRPPPPAPAPYSPPAPAPYSPPAPYKPAPSYSAPAQYEYAYSVQDDYNNVNYNANEERNGYDTKGGWEVLLPDGRTQIVTYTVSGDSGMIADVQYKGTASYAPAPAPYKPAPPSYPPPPPPKYGY